MTLYSISHPVTDRIPDILKDSFRFVGYWAGRAIKVIRDLSQQMHSNQKVAFAVLITANAIFFTFTHLFADYLERYVASCPKKRDHVEDEYNFNRFLINVVVVGSSMLTCNVLFAKMTQYSLSSLTLMAISVGAIAARFLVTSFRKNEIKSEEQLKKEAAEKQAAEEKERIEKAAVIKAQQQKFMEGFCNEVRECLSKDLSYVKFSSEQTQARELFLTQMLQGVAVIEDQPDICRAVCVSIQAAFESVLAKKLKSGELKKVNANFLTGLPCTPLRTPLKEIDVSKEAEWKKWTVEIRTQTVRNLREAGAEVGVYYDKTEYQNLASKAQIEFDTYELEKQKPNTKDVPLDTAVPKELIGAFYIFTDKEGNCYQMATQGIQIQKHGETPKECWKKWLSALGGHQEAGARVREMIDFINNNQKQFRLTLEQQKD